MERLRAARRIVRLQDREPRRRSVPLSLQRGGDVGAVPSRAIHLRRVGLWGDPASSSEGRCRRTDDGPALSRRGGEVSFRHSRRSRAVPIEERRADSADPDRERIRQLAVQGRRIPAVGEGLLEEARVWSVLHGGRGRR